MAENESSSSMEAREEKKTKNNNLGFPFSIFQEFKLPHLGFPPLKKVEVGEVGVISKGKESSSSGGEDGDGKGPSLVRVPIPDAPRADYPSLKLESEEEVQGGHGNMWQVYALGGFMILRWLWGRWKESRANNSDKPQSGSAPGDQPTNAES